MATAVIGQVVGVLVLVFSLFLAARVENGGIWVAPNWGDVAVAIVLSVLLCAAAVARGPLPADGEVEGIDEPA